MPTPLASCAARAEAGQKARTLAQLAGAGLPVLPGFVVMPDEPLDEAALAAALAALGSDDVLARSSASVEDRLGASAAGVFDSLPARGAAELVTRVAAVRASVARAADYLRARGLDPDSVRMAVLVQPRAAAQRLGVAVAGADGALVIEERAAREPEWGEVAGDSSAAAALAALLAATRAALALPSGLRLVVEYALVDGAPWLLQARALPAPPPEPTHAVAPPPLDRGRWRQDVEHNPLPLSPAQAALVRFVEALGVGARQALHRGYLYVEAAPGRRLTPLPLASLPARFADELAPECRARLDAALADGSLAAALAAYAHVYQRYLGEVSPAVARARAQLEQLLVANLGEPLARHAGLLGGNALASLAREQSLWQLGRGARTLDEHLLAYGAYAPGWDVALSPDDEAPARVLALAARVAAAREAPELRHQAALAARDAAAHAVFDRLDRMARRAWKALWPLVQAALPIADEDDALFYAAQRVVRRALRALGADWAARGALAAADDIFFAPLELAAPTDAPPAGLAEAVAAARRADVDARRDPPPLELVDGCARNRLSLGARTVLLGHGTGGQARGRARQLRDGADLRGAPGEVLVAAALTPALSPLIAGAAALVTAHGGAHSHGALLAREHGVPAVVGAAGALDIPDDATVIVDADLGRVFVL